MKRTSILSALLAATALINVQYSWAGQVPGPANAPDVAISHKDRFYTSDQFSNTVSVIDPMDNKLLGVLRLGAASSCAIPPSPC
jgi:DNA-binding beta-propeller fold protein YncE